MKRILLILLALAACLTTGSLTAADDTNSDAGLDLKSFQIISQRNIFNPNRRASRAGATYRPPRTDSFTLVGTLSYEKGRFAFFDGNSSEYRKTLKVSDTIAGYKITAIAANYVNLGAASNKVINLPVGTQMKRPEGGHWTVAGRAEPADYSSPITSSSSAPAPGTPSVAPSSMPGGPPGDASDVVKRLMLKRQSEK